MHDLLLFPSAIRRDPRIHAWFCDFPDPLLGDLIAAAYRDIRQRLAPADQAQPST